MVVANNWTNLVVEFLEPLCIAPSGSSQTQMLLNGIQRLLQLCERWDHVVYLSGLDLPLRPPRPRGAPLQPGMSYFPLRELTEADLRNKSHPELFREWLTDCPNPTMNARHVMGQRDPLPGLAYAHSDNVYVLSRPLADWLVNAEFPRLLWLYFRTTRHAQEHYIPTAVATDRSFLDRVVRRSLTYFEHDLTRKAVALHEGRYLRNSTSDVAAVGM